MNINQLKGLRNVEISFNKNLVAIMGVNGAGKSTILHALACTYSKYEKGEDYKFNYFFTPSSDATWVDSSFEVLNYDENTKTETQREYKKKDKRWINYKTRPRRDLFFLGIESCIPEIEKEKKTSFIKYTSVNQLERNTEKIINAAAFILQKDYDQLVLNDTAKKKKYMGVSTKGGLKYSSLSMGAGEQRVLKILQTVYNANQYSLILIDEIDLLLHVDALKKLIITLAEVATNKKLQIIFTTHSLEMQNLMEYVDIKYIEHGDKTFIYDSINPDLLYKLSGEIIKPYSIYVEDDLAEIIVKKVLRDNNMIQKVNVIRMGAIENAAIIAACKVIDGSELDNVLIVTDGDKYVNEDEKKKLIDHKWSGTEKDKDIKVNQAVKLISQLNLPRNMPPEKYIHSLLVESDESLGGGYIKFAKTIVRVNDSHDWLGKIAEYMGEKEMTYNNIINIVSQHPNWKQYVDNVDTWVKEKIKENI